MADRKPLKVLPDSASGTGGGDSTGIGEFVAGDTLGVVDGGTGLAAVGANQLLTGHNSSTTGALTSESNLTFDGSTLTVAGDQVITDGNGLISGHTARVQVSSSTGENQILGTTSADANLSITRYSNDNGPPNLIFGKSRSGSLAGQTIVADGDPLGRISFCGSDGVDMRSIGALIEAECDGEFEADNVSGRLVFATTPDSAGVQDPVERMRIDSTGAVTKPAQPAFFAGVTDNLDNVTGDGTAYTAVFPTEQFDTGGDYATGTGVFTAPVAGRYQFNGVVWIGGLTSSHTGADLSLKTSDCPAITFEYTNPYVNAVGGTDVSYSGSCVIDMDAADTAELVITVFSGSKVCDVRGSGGATHPRSHFSGFLVG